MGDEENQLNPADLRLGQAAKPPILDITTDRGETFRLWKGRWDAFFLLSGLNKHDANTQYAALITCLSDETLKVVTNLSLAPADKQNVEKIIEALSVHAQGQLNVIIERRAYNLRVQHENETFDDFLTDLRELAKTCDFCQHGDCMNQRLRDSIVVGIKEGDTTEKLLEKSSTLTLDKTIDVCRADEAARYNRTVLKGDTECSANAVKRNHHKPNVNKKQTQDTAQKCGRCGYNQHDKRACPAKNKKCTVCSKIGHFAAVCFSKSKQQNKPPSHQNKQSKGLCSIIANTVSQRSPTVTVSTSSVNGSAKIKATPDTGADITAAGINFLTAIGEHVNNLLPPLDQPKSADGTTMNTMGRIKVTFQLGEKSICDEVHIISGIKGCLLSWQTCINLALIHPDYPKQIDCEPIPHDQPHNMSQSNRPKPKPRLSLIKNKPTTETVTREQLIQEYSDVFTKEVHVMPGEIFKIRLTEQAVPFNVTAPRRLPFAYREALKRELDSLVQQGIITPVTYPTDWCAPIVVTPKKNSEDIRLCVDLTKLNKFVKRERYTSPTPAEAIADITHSDVKYFTSFDAVKGYHQCPLDKASQDLTTFITPFGRFKFLRAPFGLSSISEHYNRRMDEAFTGLQDFRKIVDDVIVYDNNISSHVTHVRQFLQRCRERKITLNKDKFVFAEPEIAFAGFVLNADGYKPDPKMVSAIAEFPTPSNRTDLQSFMGLVNQLASFSQDIAQLSQQLRPLLSAKNEFCWTETHQMTFDKMKKVLSSPPTLAYYDPKLPISLHTDGSKLNGLGFVLKQKQRDQTWKVIQAGSRYLTDAESRYVAIELELLAATWAVHKCRLFLQGLQHFNLVTDHKPLIPILNSHQLDEIENPRLQRLRQKLMMYNLTAYWNKGVDHKAPDALSRHPIDHPTPSDEIGESSDINVSVSSILSTTLPCAQLNLRLEDVKQCHDPESEMLYQFTQEGFPESKCDLPEILHPYWNVRHNLSLDDDLVVYGCRLVIPAPMRHTVLRYLHDGHQGKERAKQRARQVVYWPNIDRDIDNITRSCKECQKELPSLPKETYTRHQTPERPFQHISADFGTYAGQQFLIVVDNLSGWPFVFQLGSNAPTRKLINSMKEVFCFAGAPDRFYSDGGPQFTGRAFQDFLKQWGVQFCVSSPHYPQSNSYAEAAVKSMKKLIRKCWDSKSRGMDMDKWTKAILQYRNTPKVGGRSPAQVLFNKPIQDMIPAHRRAFAPEWQKAADVAEKTAFEHKSKVETRYNLHSRDLPRLQIGNKVAIQNHKTKVWDIYGTIVDIGHNRKYFVKLPSGRVLTRNRRFIRRRYAQAMPAANQPVPLPEVQAPAADIPVPVAQPAPIPPPRRSRRVPKKPERLIETI